MSDSGIRLCLIRQTACFVQFFIMLSTAESHHPADFLTQRFNVLRGQRVIRAVALVIETEDQTVASEGNPAGEHEACLFVGKRRFIVKPDIVLR